MVELRQVMLELQELRNEHKQELHKLRSEQREALDLALEMRNTLAGEFLAWSVILCRSCLFRPY